MSGKSDKELADKVVQLGVGIKSARDTGAKHDLYDLSSFPYPVVADVFVRDPRVAMELMEKMVCIHVESVHTERIGDCWEVRELLNEDAIIDKSLPRS